MPENMRPPTTFADNHRWLMDEMQRAGHPVEPWRRSGRSTIIAFRAIADAMATPRTWVRIQDHHGTREADKWLMRMTKDYLSRLGFTSFSFKGDHGEWIRFDL